MGCSANGRRSSSVVTDVSSSSPVSIFMNFVPFVYAICEHNSVVHFKVNTVVSPPHKSPESYSNSSTKDSTGIQVSSVGAFGCHGYRDDLIQYRRFALWISEGFCLFFI